MTHMTATRTEHADFGPAQIARGGGKGRVLQRTLDAPRKRALLEVVGGGADGFLSAAELHRRLCAYRSKPTTMGDAHRDDAGLLSAAGAMWRRPPLTKWILVHCSTGI
jgi:hypothetical protein